LRNPGVHQVALQSGELLGHRLKQIVVLAHKLRIRSVQQGEEFVRAERSYLQNLQRAPRMELDMELSGRERHACVAP
jgi:hypothetical protein